MTFNEIRRNLEDGASREARIRELTESLQRRGLAMTRESARQLAESMVATERKVQQRYQEQKERATVYNDPRSRREEPRAPARPGFLGAPSAPGSAVAAEAPAPSGESSHEPEAMAAPLSEPVTESGRPADAEPLDSHDEPAGPAAAPPDPSADPGPARDEPAGPAGASAEPSVDRELSPEMPVAEAAGFDEGYVTLEAGAVRAEEAIQPEEAPRPASEDAQAAAGSVPASAEEPGEALREGLSGSEEQLSEEAAAAAEEPAGREEAREVPAEEAEPERSEAEEPAPEREDLAKKHGIDLTQMFNVNK